MGSSCVSTSMIFCLPARLGAIEPATSFWTSPVISSTIAVITSTSSSYCVPASVSADAAATVWVPVVALFAIRRAFFDAVAVCERAIFSWRATAALLPRRA